MPETYLDLVHLWSLCNRSDMAQPTLPETGGMLDQSMWLMEAFSIIGTVINKKRENHVP